MLAKPATARHSKGLTRPCGWGLTAGKYLRQSLTRQNCLQVWFVTFDSVSETSRNLVETCTWAIWRGTTQFGGQIWTAQAGSCSIVPLSGKFLLLISLLTWLSTSKQILEYSIKGSTKQGQSENRSGWLPQVHYPRFSILPIIWMSVLFPMFPRASRTIMDNSLHVSLALYASWVHEDHATSTWKISLKIKFQRSCFCSQPKQESLFNSQVLHLVTKSRCQKAF